MFISPFRKPYVIRRYQSQEIERGYAKATYDDVVVLLTATSLSSNTMETNQEGFRTISRVKTIGTDELISADQYIGRQSDRLFYHGKWYECKSCIYHHHTFIRHFQSEFVLLERQEPPPTIDEEEFMKRSKRRRMKKEGST